MRLDQVPVSESHTDRLDLNRPAIQDLDQVYAISSDPRVWEHFPSGRHATRAQTADLLDRWISGWTADGLGPWIARRTGETSVIGYGGCNLVSGAVWNLGYRFAAAEHGYGYATELARQALRAAEELTPELPVVAYMLEDNVASARVAIKLGMGLADRGPDAGNPDPAAVRLIYASRSLSDAELAVMKH
ncbi:MAG: hypothetical protein JWP75_2545 [Frondihabitans sp.]|nr:hypothetical protein [Frondihabitans sp.]